jgi:hypothetical protein
MVMFKFLIGKAFLNHASHPITIPRANYKTVQQERLDAHSISIDSPFGRLTGSVNHGISSWGPYFQIRMNGGGDARDPMNSFRFGQHIIVRLEQISNGVRVSLATT